MSDFFTSILLGIVQGATEFIPVSSSGHLVVVRDFLGVNISGTLLFDIFLHIGTLIALCVYFWADVKGLFIATYRVVTLKGKPAEKKFVGMIFLATLPAVVLGFFLGGTFENFFRASNMVALALILGSVLMWYANSKYNGQNLSSAEPSLKKSFTIGLFQALALIPGISRSGATISGGMLTGLSRQDAVHFSFLLSVPVIFGAICKGLLDLTTAPLQTPFFSLLAGLVASFVVGLLAIHFLVTYMKNRGLSVFIWYRIILAFLILIFLH